ncbi:TonB-dependent receptor [Leptospira kanakyensis]|uniref:TonB-dependent receptor n=1 Tax=Leptospira kanakyensis TaxID=2484968 RepID=UPI00223D951D|nr:TonB-dependent receptor [Leptospira kanakyensis]MCW7469036.1 TonB-dependent receptor [Leptospira kanakyensis]
MNRFKTIFFLILFVGIPSVAYAQQGSIRGEVLDASTAEPMFGVTVLIRNPQKFAKTDLDGKYELVGVPEGTHTLEFVMIGMETVKKSVSVQAGKTEKVNLVMGAKKLDEVLVQDRAMNDTEASLLKYQKKAAAVSDGISAEAIAKTPDSSAGDVMRRVTGITLVGGKYVFVRGLGERYSNTMFNGVPLPSPEPDKRVVPLDLFPAAMIKNIVVSKTFIPEDSAEFSGGTVKIETKEYPDKYFFKFGLKLGYNANTTNQNWKTYSGGGQDWLGIDEGNRKKPSIVDTLPNAQFVEGGRLTGGYPREIITAGSLSFNNQWSPKQTDAPWNKGLDISTGNVFKFSESVKWGTLFAVTYNRDNQFKQEIDRFNLVGSVSPDLPREGKNRVLLPVLNYRSRIYEETVSWGTMFNNTLDFGKGQRVYWKNFFSVNNDKQVREYEGINNNIPFELQSTKLNYVMRNIFNSSIGGDHRLPIGETVTKFDWVASYSEANRNQPDMRDTTYATTPGTAGTNGAPLLSSPNIGYSSRFFSESKDISRYVGVNYEIPFKQWSGFESKFKTGYSAVDRERNFEAEFFSFVNQNGDAGRGLANQSLGSRFYPLPPEAILNPFNRGANGYQIREFTRPTDKYMAQQKIHSYYGQFDLPIIKDLRFIGGARYEDNYQAVRTFNPFSPRDDFFARFDYRSELDPFLRNLVDPNYRQTNAKLANRNVLPSANFVYSLNDITNIRFAYTQTLTRPDFRELSPFEFTDILGGPPVKGNPDLKQTYIHNYDLRYETFPGGEDFFAVGVFRKNMIDPIERVVQVDNQFRYSFVNAKQAYIQGAEIEARKGLGFISEYLERWSLGINTFFIKSEVQLNDWAYYQLAQMGVINDVNRPTSLSRPLQGQSPYVYNFNLRYRFDKQANHTITFLFNEFGRRINSVGGLGIPDTYESPVGVFDAVYSLKYDEKLIFKVAARNLNDARVKIVQENPVLGREETVYSYRTGPTITMSATYNFD